MSSAGPGGWLWNGVVFEPVDGIPMSDRGFRYGMSVFESLPVREGKPLFLEEHLFRLRQACTITGLLCDEGALGAVRGALTEEGDGFARVYVTAGDGPVTGAIDQGRVCVFVEPRELTPERTYHWGYDLRSHPEPHRPLYAGFKTGNYWANVAAIRESIISQCNETLFFNHEGHLISAAMANVFVVIDGKLKTPPFSAGARDGVIREWVLHQKPAEEALLTRAEVAAADEIFLTNSWLGIMPVAALDLRTLPSRSTAMILRSAYLAATS